MTDMAVLGLRSRMLRGERAAVRRALSTGSVRVLDVLADPPDCISEVLLVDLLRWQRALGDGKLRRLNTAALMDGVNLCVPVRLCSTRTRMWLAVHLAVGHTWTPRRSHA